MYNDHSDNNNCLRRSSHDIQKSFSFSCLLDDLFPNLFFSKVLFINRSMTIDNFTRSVKKLNWGPHLIFLLLGVVAQSSCFSPIKHLSTVLGLFANGPKNKKPQTIHLKFNFNIFNFC